MAERIRPASESDLGAAAALTVAREAASVRSGPGLFRAWQPDPDADQVSVQQRALTRTMEHGDHVALVAEDEGRVVGFVVIGGIGQLPPPHVGPSTASLAAFDVEPDRWTSAGPALLRAALDGARERGVEFVTAECTAPEAEKRRVLEAFGMRVDIESWWMPLGDRGGKAEPGAPSSRRAA